MSCSRATVGLHSFELQISLSVISQSFLQYICALLHGQKGPPELHVLQLALVHADSIDLARR